MMAHKEKPQEAARRVVITGAGLVTPIGQSVERFWQQLTAGQVGISPLPENPLLTGRVSLAGQVQAFDPLSFLDRKEARRMDRCCQFAVYAAEQAVIDSGLDLATLDPYRVGVTIGSGVGGLETMATEYRKLYLDGGPARVSPLFIPMMIANMAAGHVSMRFSVKGSSTCVTTACASGAHAIGEAFRAIKHGYLDACLAGGAEAPITPIALAGFDNMKALSHATDPLAASIPFDRRRDGFVIGEGAGLVVLESLANARRRGARILCEIAGYGSTADAYHITSPDPDGAGAARAMALALAEAGLSPADVSYINAHGTSTPLNDAYETRAIRSVFAADADRLAVSSNKSMTGHLLGAAGAVEAIATALTLDRSLIPPTAGLEVSDPDCDLDYVPRQARQQVVQAALSNALGFGGHNASLCLRKVKDHEPG